MVNNKKNYVFKHIIIKVILSLTLSEIYSS